MEASTRSRLRKLARAHHIPTLPVTSTLDMAMRFLIGGREQFIEYVHMASLDQTNDFAEAAGQWWVVWQGMTPMMRMYATLDDICAAAGVSRKHIVQAIVGMAIDLQCEVADLVAAFAHPEIVAKTIEYAKTPAGAEERRMLLSHAGFLPQPKGTNILVSQRVGNLVNGTQPPQLPPDVPSFADDIKKLSATTEGVQAQLEAGVKPADLVLEGEVLIPVKQAGDV
jgi:hypothetical protein